MGFLIQRAHSNNYYKGHSERQTLYHNRNVMSCSLADSTTFHQVSLHLNNPAADQQPNPRLLGGGYTDLNKTYRRSLSTSIAVKTVTLVTWYTKQSCTCVGGVERCCLAGGRGGWCPHQAVRRSVSAHPASHGPAPGDISAPCGCSASSLCCCSPSAQVRTLLFLNTSQDYILYGEACHLKY